MVCMSVISMRPRAVSIPLLVFVSTVVVLSTALLYVWVQQHSSVNQSDSENQRKVILSIHPDEYIYGDPNAVLVLFVYADTECQFCKKLYFKIQDIVAEYSAQHIPIAVVYRHAPLGLWDKSVTEAQAAECVGETQGARGYYTFLDRLYTATPSDNGLNVDILPALATAAGADKAAFATCMKLSASLTKVKEQKLSAVALGVSTVPHLFIAGKSQIYEVVGNKPKDTITFLIDHALHGI